LFSAGEVGISKSRQGFTAAMGFYFMEADKADPDKTKQK
jgi:hypothetical protein